jgi:hypothetical protein
LTAAGFLVASGKWDESIAQTVIPEVSVRPIEIPSRAEPLSSAKPFNPQSGRKLRFDDSAVRSNFTAGEDQLVISGPIAGCPLVFLDTSIHKYSIVYEKRYAAVLADEKSALHQDVCECRLLPGDYRACAMKEILDHATPIAPSARPAGTTNRVHISVADVHEFESIYAELLTAAPTGSIKTLPAGGFGGGGGGGGNHGIPPGFSAVPTPKHLIYEHKCEQTSKVCISPHDGKVSAEFSVKCDNLPEVTFSTDGDVSMKLGPISVSFSGK